MRTDNPEHKTLFSIPDPSYSTALATTKPLPPQRKITGHKQTDAYLWILEVIKLNEPAHLSAAEDALKKLKITPEEAQKRYRDYLSKSGVHPFEIAFGTINLNNPAGYLRRARENISRAGQVRAIFGSCEAALENTEAENRMLSGEMGDVYAACRGWTQEELDAGCVQGVRCSEIDNQRRALSQGFVSQLPAPHTLSDIVREYEYWRWLYSMRDCAAGELGYQYGDGDRNYIYDRESHLEGLLAIIRPVSRQEAVSVCEWVLDNESLMDRGDLTRTILLNLAGECDA